MSKTTMYGKIVTGPRIYLGTVITLLLILISLLFPPKLEPETEVLIPVTLPVVVVTSQVAAEPEVAYTDTSYRQGKADPHIIELADYAGEHDTVVVLNRVSFYNLVPTQTSHDPSTSSCSKTVERQIAVSRDLFFDENRRKHLCGARVTVITDSGHVFEDYVLNDTMHERWELSADVVYPGTTEADVQAALAMGIPTGTLIIHAD